jgi:diacylglycerol kinase (ATP)
LSVRILYNPASGRGRGARAIAAIKAAFARFGFTDVRATKQAGDEERLTHEAMSDGVETLVVAGGDGTVSKCAVELARCTSPTRLAIVAAGTGNDFIKNFATHPREAAVLAARLAGGIGHRQVDVLRVEDRLFLNVVGFGFDVAVLAASNRTQWLKGPAVYLSHAVRQLFSFRGIEFGVDGEAPRRRLIAALSNGAWFGGTFQIAPGAVVDDGKLDLVMVDDVPPLARVPLLAGVIRGTHLASPHCDRRRAPCFRLTFEDTPWMDADGELVRAPGNEITIASVPGALRIVDSPAVD